MKNRTSKPWRGTLFLLLISLFFLVITGTAAAADGEIWINTTDIKGVPGQTCQVPVMVTTSGEPIYNVDLQITNPTNNAAVKFNASSITTLGGMVSADDNTGGFSGIGFTIVGTNQIFFYLDVTPYTGTVDDVPLNITVSKVGEGTLDTLVPKNYKATNATLHLYRALTFTIEATAGAHGSIDPSGTVTVAEDASKTFTITPDHGYKIADVLVDDVSIGATNTYTFNNVNANHKIEAVFEPETYTITWIDGDGNTLGTDNVPYGEKPAYTGEIPTKTGDAQYTYSFNGTWTPAVTAVIGNAEYKANFDATVNTYTVTWENYNGTVLEIDNNVPYDTMPEYNGITPSRDDDARNTYTFSGWNTAVTNVTGNVNYTATYTSELRSYNIQKVTSVNGTFTVPVTAKVDEQVTIEVTPNTGFELDTITVTKTDNTPVTIEGTSFTMPESDVSITVTFKPIIYTITWIDGDGHTLKTESVPYGEKPAYTGAIPTKTGDAQYTYSFNGTWTPAVIAVIGNAEYKANFDATVNTYTVTWENYNGTVLEIDNNVPYDTMPEYNGITPSRDDDARNTYTFSGWNPAVTNVTGNVNYTATYTSELRSYTIQKVTSVNGTFTVPATAKVDEQVTIEVTPNTGFELDTITVTKTDNTPVTIDNGVFTMPVSDVSVTVAFKPIIYTITWIDGDGQTLKTDNVPYGEKPAYTGEIPTKTGDAQYTYSFNGTWTPAVTAVTGNTQYTANFDATVNTYTVTWENYNGTVLEIDSDVPYDTMPEYNGATPSRDDDARNTYTFSGWNPVVTNVTGNVNYTATFTETLRTYDITVAPTVNGTVNVPTQATVDGSVTITVTPEEGFELDSLTVTTETGEPVALTGYTFQMPTSDVTVSASFKHINYTVDRTGVQNGTVTSSHDTAHKGETVTLTLADLHPGHIFNNFVVVNESGVLLTVTLIDDKNATFVMPANHVSVSLNVTKIDYTITVTPSVNGTATAPATAQVGDKVTVTVTPESGYQFSKLNVTSETGQTVAATGKTFVMPAENVIVNAEFTKIPPTSSGGGSSGSSVWIQPTQVPTVTPTATPTATPSETVPTTVPTTEVSETHVADINNDGSADFAQSQIIFSVTLPEDHPGTVELTTDIDTADTVALAGKEIYHAAEITLDHPLAEGETATVHFMIPIAELERRGLTAADVCLYHHDHDGLTALAPVYEVIGNTVYYESTATEFSPFIIVFEENGATPSTEPVKTPVPTTPESPAPLLAVLAGLGVVALLRRR